jgi:hypothetical protein
VLRDIKALVNRLPTMDSPEFKADFLHVIHHQSVIHLCCSFCPNLIVVSFLLIIQEYNDALLIAYLTTITKGSNMINDVMDKFNLTHASSRRGGGGGGMMSMMGGPMGMGPMGGFGPMGMGGFGGGMFM